ncbi:MAG: hypothetical protein J3R72DRAFT_518507 [Linnemannia gamsii]|nr:MAG: hypothetical protein J3R72DRAFT_518507 [Linnemannia gamsii]
MTPENRLKLQRWLSIASIVNLVLFTVTFLVTWIAGVSPLRILPFPILGPWLDTLWHCLHLAYLHNPGSFPHYTSTTVAAVATALSPPAREMTEPTTGSTTTTLAKDQEDNYLDNLIHLISCTIPSTWLVYYWLRSTTLLFVGFAFTSPGRKVWGFLLSPEILLLAIHTCVAGMTGVLGLVDVVVSYRELRWKTLTQEETRSHAMQRVQKS